MSSFFWSMFAHCSENRRRLSLINALQQRGNFRLELTASFSRILGEDKERGKTNWNQCRADKINKLCPPRKKQKVMLWSNSGICSFGPWRRIGLVGIEPVQTDSKRRKQLNWPTLREASRDENCALMIPNVIPAYDGGWDIVSAS